MNNKQRERKMLSNGLIFEERDVHSFLNKHGFSTNFRKHENENGTDIIAIKNGHCFLIEHKKAMIRDNGVYRYAGDIKGDVVIFSLPSGRFFFGLKEASFTKTCRLIEMLNENEQ